MKNWQESVGVSTTSKQLCRTLKGCALPFLPNGTASCLADSNVFQHLGLEWRDNSRLRIFHPGPDSPPANHMDLSEHGMSSNNSRDVDTPRMVVG
jgi:hypothetical protein